MNRVHYSSVESAWETPQWLFDKLDQEFHFDLDVCATPTTTKCRKFFTPEDDGLIKAWQGRCWMNPPYGKVISKWMKKAVSEWKDGCVVVCLIPARTDTEWWHEYAMQGEIRFLRGRLRFGNAKSSAPFPSAIIVFRDQWWKHRGGL